MNSHLLVLIICGLSFLTQAQNSSDFTMPIEDVFYIQGRGAVVTGRIHSGTIKNGDTVELLGLSDKSLILVVSGIEQFRKTLEEAKAGDNVGLLFKQSHKEDFKRGMLLANPKTLIATKTLKAECYVLTSEEGGSGKSLSHNSTNTIQLWGSKYSLNLHVLSKNEMLAPGETGNIQIQLETNPAVKSGLNAILFDQDLPIANCIIQ